MRGRCFVGDCPHVSITRIGLLHHLCEVHAVHPDPTQTSWVDFAIEDAFPPEP